MITGRTWDFVNVSIGSVVAHCDTQVPDVSNGFDETAVVRSVAGPHLKIFVGAIPDEFKLAIVELLVFCVSHICRTRQGPFEYFRHLPYLPRYLTLACRQ